MKNLVTYNPNRVVSVFDDFDKLVESFFGNDFAYPARMPVVDIREEGDKYIVEAELPGLSEKDVEVKIQDKVLTIESHKESEEKEEKKNYLMRERRVCSFKRTFSLPKNIAYDKVSAVFKDGLLTITLPKSEDAQEKVISIKRG